MGCAILLAAEILGMALMLTAVPVAWFWIGSKVGAATGSLSASAGLAFLGFVATVVVIGRMLQRIDNYWIELRLGSSHRRSQGPLPNVIVISMTFAILAFVVWYYWSGAFVLPFMPSGA